MKHELKTWCGPFQAVLDGRKAFEVRFNDRGFKEGDLLFLREWDHERKEYTGNATTKRVTYIIEGEFGIPEGICVMSLGEP